MYFGLQTPYLFALDYVNDVRRAISIAKPNYDLDQYAVQGCPFITT